MRNYLYKAFLYLGLIVVSGQAIAQDMHFSQYSSSPLMLNPALAGMNTCDYRIYTNFRVQWPTVTSSGFTYRTFALGADMSMGKITKFNSFAGAGISFSSDQAGDLNYSTNRVDLTLAYHFMLNQKGTVQISAGLQGGFNYKGIDFSKAIQDGQYDPSTGQINQGFPKETLARDKVLFGDAGLGILFSAVTKNDVNFYTGFAMNHVNQPKISFYPDNQVGNSNERLYMKFTLHGGASIPLDNNGRTSLIPNYAVFVQGPAYEFLLGCNIKTTIGSNVKAPTSAVHFGVSYRGLLDAVIFNFRYDYKGFSGGLSYDINVSKLIPASKTIGAPELSLVYQGCYRKKPRPGHCPVMF